MLPLFFFFNDTATTEIYTLSLHDALPISLHAARPPDRPRLTGPQLRDALPVRHPVLPHHPGRQGDALPLPTRGGGRPRDPELHRDLALVAAVPPAAGGDTRREVRCLRVPQAVRRRPRAGVRARRGRGRGRPARPRP